MESNRDLHEVQYHDDRNRLHHYKEFRRFNNKSLVKDLINKNSFMCENGYLQAKVELIKMNPSYRVYRDMQL